MAYPKDFLRSRFKSIMELFNDRTSKRDDSIRLESLEPRVMFDASPLAAAIQEIGDADVHAVDLEVAADLHHLTFSTSTDNLELADIVDRINDLGVDIDHAIDLLSVLSAHDGSNGILETENSIFDVGLAAVSPALDPAANELVVIDSHVDGYDQLLADLEHQIAAGRNLEILLLDASQDGIAQITDYLQQFSQIDSLQIISHGGETGFQLGSSWINGDDLSHYSEQLSQWQTVLSESADISIYGCNLAASESGQSLLNELAHLTGADIAASDDLTGHELLGGDWVLEFQIGAIESVDVFSHEVHSSWMGTLSVYTVTNTLDDGSVGSLRWAIEQANANGGADTIDFNIAGTGIHTINVGSTLTITDTVTIDATSDDSFTANGNKPAIVLDGDNSFIGDGMVLTNSADGSTIRGFVIRDFSGDGIQINSGSDNNTIAGNYIGRLTATGADAGAAEANTGAGINLLGSSNTIGGLTTADRNVIAGNVDGIYMQGASDNLIVGNYIGTDGTGLLDLGNTDRGIQIESGSNNNTIGGTTAGARNVISGNNNDGIIISDGASPGTGTTGTVIQGNYIGVGSDGTTDVGNGTNGVRITTESGHTIGGTVVGAGNVIAYSGEDGVMIQNSSANTNSILGNTIYSNAQLGIDLGNDGVTANDALANKDSDTGANDLQNFAVLTSAGTDGSGKVAVAGSLNTTANTTARIEFFVADVAAAGNGEGKIYLGYTTVITNSSGNAGFVTSFDTALAAGQYITSTTTVMNVGGTYGSTSEFSANVQANSALIVDTTNDVVDGTTTSVAALLAGKGADGFISLREAIIATNNTGGTETIFLPAGTFTFTIGGFGEDLAATGDLDITDNVTIVGAGTGLTFIDGGALDRVIQVHSGTVGISELTIQNGLLTSGATHGAGISIAVGADLTIDTVDVVNNQVTGASSYGGGIYNAGIITAVDSSISNNSATSGGGGLYNIGTATLSNSLISANAGNIGGGIYHTGGGTLDLTNVTISGNTSNGNGGGIYTDSTVYATNITVTDNESTGFSAGGVRASAGAFNVSNSIIAGNRANTVNVDFYGTATSGGYNIVGDTTGSTGFGGTDKLNVSPTLGILANNGGPTQTHALLPGSRGIDKGTATGAPAIDQRGIARGVYVDIGAFEVPGVTADALWLSTKEDVVSSGAPGLSAWTDGELLEFGGPNLAFEPTGTDGAFSSAVNFNSFFDGANVDLGSQHYVTKDITVGSGANTFDLFAGDVLFSFEADQTIGATTYSYHDLHVFHPATPGDYSSGTISVLLEGLADFKIRAITLVEQDTWVGDVLLQAGEFLYFDNNYAAEIRHFDATGVGVGTTAGTKQTFLNSTGAYNVTQDIVGLELIEVETTIGGETLAAGTILVSAAEPDIVGNNSLAVDDSDIFALTVSQTIMGSATSSATAAMFMDGSLVGLADTGEDIVSLTLHATVTGNSAPTISLPAATLNYAEGDGAVVIDATATATDADSADFDTGTLTVDFTANGTANDRLSINNEGAGTGQIGVSGSNVSYEGTTIGTFAGGTDGATPLVITFNSSSTPAAAQALMRNITYANVSDAPSTAARTVRFELTDGDGGTSNAKTEIVTVTAVNDAPTFGIGTGAVVTDIGTSTDGAMDLIEQPDGKYLVAGYGAVGGSFDFTLVRHNEDGTLDTGFGSGGVVTTSLTAGNDVGQGVAIQSDGKIIVAGYDSNYDFAVARYNSDGTLDTGFGTGGTVTTSVGGTYDFGYKVVVQDDGKIVVAGNSRIGSFYDTSLVRYNTDGSLDSGFGTGGMVITAVSASNDGATDLVLQTDGKILVAGQSNNGTDTDFAVTRYNIDGSLDTSFGTGGTVTTPIGTGDDAAESIVLQTDGKIVVAGWTVGTDNDFAVVRYNSDGNLDTSFGSGGKVTAAIGVGDDRAYDVAIQADGKILVTGRSDMGASYDFSLLRYNSDGSLDLTFGTGGVVTTDVGSNADYGYSVLQKSDGTILVAGHTSNGMTSDFGLVRYNADGSLYENFNPVNTLDGSPTFIEGGAPVVLDTDVQVFDQELSPADDFSGATLTLARNGGANAEDAYSATGNLNTLTQGGNLVLSGVTVGNVTTNSAGTLVLTFNSNATQARVNEVMQSIAYSNSSDAPPTAAQIDWTFNDGNTGAQGSGGALTATGSTIVNITAVNDLPTALNNTVLANEDTVFTFTAADFNFSDVDGDTLASVKITSLETAGALQLSGADVTINQVITKTDIDAGNLKFVPVADANGTGYDSFEFSVNDGTTDSAGTYTLTIDVTAVNDDPANAGSLPTDITVTEDVSSNVDLSAIDLSDIDEGGGSLTVTLSTSTGGNLTAASGGGVTVGGSGTGTVTITGTQSDLNTFLNTASNITYLHGTTHTTGNDADTIQVDVSDNGNTGSGGGGTISLGVVNVDITAVNDAPVISIDDVPLFYLSGRLDVDPSLVITDVDDTMLQSAQVSFGDGYSRGHDRLRFVDQLGITGSFSVSTGILTLTGSASVADYQTALRSVQYEDIQASPALGILYVDFTVFDGTDTSLVDTRIIEIVDNLPPRAGDDFGTVSEGNSIIIDLAGNDTDSENALDLTSIVIISGPANGSLLVNPDGTVTFTHDGSETSSDTFTYTIKDVDGNVSNEAPVTVTVTPVNDSPAIGSNTGAAFDEGSTGNAITTSMLNESDPDDSGTEITYTLDSVPVNGRLYLSGAQMAGGATFTQEDIDLGRITYDHNGTETNSDSFDFTITDGGEDGSAPVSDTFLITITPVNDNNPIITSNGGGATASISINENTTAVTTVTATDADLPAQTMTYSKIGGADEAKFTIDGSTGVLSFIAAPDYENPTDVGADNTYEVIIQVSDGTLTDVQTITVSVNNVAEGIRVTPLSVGTLGGETLINTTTGDIQSINPNVSQAMATDANGNYIVVWVSNAQDGDLYGIYAQRFNADGVPQGTEFQVNTTTADNQINSAVAMDAAGNFVVAWASNLQDGSSYGIYAQLYDAAGVAQGGEFLVNTTTAGGQTTPAIAMAADGSFVISWSSGGQDPDGSTGIYAQRFDASGAALGSEFRVNTFTTGIQQLTSIAMDSTGNFVITWASDTQDGSNYGVYGQRYDSSGVALGAEFLVNTTTIDSQLYHDVTMLKDGRFVVAYQSRNGSTYDVYIQRYEADGTTVGGETRVNTTTVSGYQPIPSISADADGNITVVWNNSGDGAGAGVYGQRLDWSGNLIGSEFLVNSTTTGNQLYAEVVAQTGGRFIVAWGGEGAGDTAGVFMQRFGLTTTEAGGTATFQIVLEVAPTADVTIPIMVSNGSEGSVSVGSVTFTSLNWMTPQTVTITGLQDYTNDGDQAFSVVLGSATSSDANFNGLDPDDLSIINREVPNTAPVNTVPAAQITNEDTDLIFSSGNGNAISISDSDAGGNLLEVTLSATNGALSLSTLSGLAFSTGDGTSDANMTFTGTIASINAALDGLAFEPAADYNGAASVTITTNDQGNSGTGGSQLDSDIVNITVTAVNDVPTLNAGTVNNLTVNEDSGFTSLGLGGLNYGPGGGADEAGQTLTYEITVIPDSTYFGKIFLADGITQVTTGFYSLSDLQGMQFQTVADASGGPSFFSWNIVDNGGTAGGGQDTYSQFILIDITPVNDTPTIATNTGLTVNEGDVGTMITAVMLNEGDPDDSGTELIYTVTSAPTSGTLRLSGIALTNGGTFTQEDVDFGRLTYDHNGAEVFTDGFDFSMADGGEDGSSPATGTFNITVMPVNDNTPIINSDGGGATASINVAENSTTVTTVTATDSDLPPELLTYTIAGGADSALFSIDNMTGALTFVSGRDRENHTDADLDGIYDVTVQVSDGTFFDQQTISVTIADVDEFDVGLVSDTDGSTNEVAEDATIGTAVGITAFAEDLDATNNTISYTLDDDAGGLFAIDSVTGVVTVNGALDYETATSHNITVRASSSDGSSNTQGFVINVTDVNESAITSISDSDGTADFVLENVAVGTTVGVTAFADDVDASDTVSYSLDDDAGGLFAIDSVTGVVTVNGAIDRETASSYDITVRATSTDTSSSTKVLTIAIGDVDEFDVGAVTDSDLTANAVDENAANGTVVGVTALASDADATNNTITYSLNDNAGGRFAIDSSTGVVTVADGTLLDREAAASHDITVRATSSDGSFNTQLMTININDVDEFDVGTVSDLDGATNEVDENAIVGTVVGITADASDDDATTNTITYSLQDNDGGRFSIDSSTGIVRVAGAIDREADGATRNITVRATSADGSFTDQVLAININDVNEFDVTVPTDVDAAIDEVTENVVMGTTVGITADAFDLDATNNTITYSLTSNPDGLFTIDANTGVVTTAAAIDRETHGATRSITVQATSSDGSVASQSFNITINDVDEFDVTVPTDVDAAIDEVTENVVIGTTVGITADAFDLDATNNTITYSLTSNPDGLFTIDANTGVVTTAAAIDREAHGATRSITVQATSSDGSVASKSFNITINDVDEFDVGAITDSDGTVNAVDENAIAGTVVGITASASDNDATTNTITYSLFDDDGGRFTIDSNSGVVTVAGTIDREADGTTRNITVRATSADGSFTDQVLAININDVDEFDVGTVTDSDGTANAVDENAIAGTVVGITASAADDDATTNTITYSLPDDDGGRFTIDSNTGVVTVAGAIDREADGATRNITVRATSADGSFADQVFAININDVDEFDVGTVNDSDGTANAVDENAIAGTVVGITASASDNDATTNAITYSLPDDDGGRFTIDSNSGVVTVAGAIDREADGATRNITVRATSADGSFTDQVLAININDVDEFDVAAVTDSDGTVNAVDENAIAGTVVGITANASDNDATTNTITYSLFDDDGGRFAIDSNSGVVTVAGAIDREADGATRNITVRATSADGSFTDQVFAININDVDEFDVGAVTDSDGTANAVDENAIAGTVVGITANATDDDATTNTITYSLFDDDGGRFTIDSNSGVVTVAGAIDREADGATRNITVRATSADGSFTDQVFAININDVDEFDVGAVTDSDGTANAVDENAIAGTVVGITANATDDDATTNTITYSLFVNDGGRFAIDSNTGVVTVAGAIDREADGATRNITVRATSADGSFTDQVLAININDVDEFDVGAVTDSDLTVNAANENPPVGLSVGIVAMASDLDATTNGIIYTLVDNDGGRFDIDGASGLVTVAGAIDREADGPTRNITVRATSADGSFTDQVFVININDVDEFDVGAIVDSDGAADLVAENANIGDAAGITALASDADATNNTILYSLDDDAGGRFAIDGSTGLITVNAALDYETNTSHNVIVRATSSDGSFSTQNFTINVTDVSEFGATPIVDNDGTSDSVSENASIGTTVGVTAFSDDADATDSITYSLDDNDGGRFAIDSSTGIVTVAGAIDREMDGATRSITVRATSTDGSFQTRVFTITVDDVDEFDVGPITDSDAAANAVDENAANGTVVGVTALASDADATNNTITYTLDDNAGGRFAIDSSTGVVTVADGTLLDREAAASHDITVRATSSDGSFNTQLMTININDVDEFDVGAVTDSDGTVNAVDENAIAGTVVGITASAADDDATTNTITYSLFDNDGGRFAIDSNTGVVTVAGAIDREADGAVRNITVRATSADGSFTDQVLAININDVDEFDVGAIVDNDVAANAVDENAIAGTVVGITASASDSDATTNTITYSLFDDDGGRFTIDSNTGVVTVAGAIDREADGAVRNITVRATSADGSFTDQVLAININDVDEFDVGPITDTDGAADSVAENANIGDSVGITALASDADATNNAILYSLDDDAGGRFAIDGSTGLITVNAALDYETSTSHNVIVRATSSDGSSSTQGFTINVTDVSEFGATPIVDNDAASDSVSENASIGTTVGVTAFSDDADATDTISYSLDDNDGGRFTIDSNTGIVTVAGAIDREADGATRSITIRATSTDGSFQTRNFTITIDDVDEIDVGPITDSDATANAVDENAANGTVVGVTALASDADATNNTITYSLDDNAGGRFAIDSSTGVVTVGDGTLLDREAAASHDITVRATSSDGSFNTQLMTINIYDVDEFDVGAVTDSDGTANAVDENAIAGTAVGITAGATDDDATTNTITYSLPDDDGGRFTIDSNSGVVTVAGAIDREADGTTRNITVRATSADGSFTDQVLAININDVDEFDVGAIVDSDAAANAVDENAIAGTVVGITASASDNDATTNAITYSLPDDDGGRFTIDSNSGVVTVAGAIDREADGTTRNITVRATSADGSFTDQVFAININDVDEFDVGAITDSDGTANAVDENAIAGTVVGITAGATDDDATTNAITYSLPDDDGGRFTIDSNSGVVTVAGAIDREADGATRNITVRATSADGSFTDQVFAININDVDEFNVGAVTDSDGTANAVDENAIAGTVVGITAGATDDDATTNAITYSLFDDDGGRFTIDSNTGVVTVAGAIDREADGATRNITVRATSADGSFTDQVLAININDVDEFDVGPITDTDGAADSVAENANIGDSVGITALASDADATNNTILYSLDDDAGGRFAIDGSTGLITVNAALDYETNTSHNVIVRATSSDGSFSTQNFTINVTDVSEFGATPIVDNDGTSDSVSENASIGTTVGVTAFSDDADATDSITYSLDDNDGGRFAIDSSTGIVTVAGAIDREMDGATRSITVRATSTDGSFQTRVFTITVDDVDEFDVGPITDSDAAANAVDENAANGTVVGVTALASDADATNNTILYTLDDNAGGRFAIDSSTGVVTVADGTLLDREAAASHDITVRATSSDGSFNTQLMTININDVNETPTDIAPGSFPVDELIDTTGGLSVGSLTATDQDLGETFTYSVVGGADTAKFSIGGPGGDELILSDGVLDFETQSAYNVIVRVTDSGGLSYDEALTVNVNDLNDAPVITSDGGGATALINVPENTTAVTTVTATDADVPADILTFWITGGADASEFTIDSSTGQLSLVSSKDFESPTDANGDGVYEVQVTVDDGSGGTDVQTINVTITGVNETPTVTSDGGGATASVNVAENTTAVTTVTAFDPDIPADTLTFWISGGADAADFVIDPSTGQLSLVTAKDFESPTDANGDGIYEVQVTVDDGNGQTDVQSINVTVTDANDAPVASPDWAAVPEGGTLTVSLAGVLANDTDQDGDSLTVSLVSGPANGSLMLNPDGTFTYTHDGSETTSDSFVYQVADGKGGVDTQTVTLTVIPVNDAPVANSDAWAVNEGATLAVLTPGVLSNDLDAEGDTLTATLLSGPAHGSLTLNADGSFTYTHDGSETTSDSFVYQVDDGNGGVDTQTVNLSINPVNDDPTITTNLPAVTDEGASIVIDNALLDIDDVDNTPGQVLVTITNPALHGQMELASNPGVAVSSFTKAQLDSGQVLYVHDGSETTTDQFDFEITDTGGGWLGSQTFTININPVNDAPVATDDIRVAVEDSALSLAASSLLDNDTDPEGDVLATTVLDGPDHALSFVLNADGTFSYQAVKDYFGSDSFTYRVDDGNGGSATATVSITVTPVNDLPVAVGDKYFTLQGETLVQLTSILANDTDVENDPLTAMLLSGPSNGTLSFSADGTFVYTPDAGFAGIDSFVYVANDGSLSSDPVAVQIEITAGNSDNNNTTPLPKDDNNKQNETEEKRTDEDDEELAGLIVADRPPAFESFTRANKDDNLDFDFLASQPAVLQSMTNRVEAKNMLYYLLSEGSRDQDEQDPNLQPGYSVVYDAQRLFDQLHHSDEDPTNIQLGPLKLSLSTITVAGTAGYILWALRGGALIATALSSTPTWQFINPMALLDEQSRTQREKRLDSYFD